MVSDQREAKALAVAIAGGPLFVETALGGEGVPTGLASMAQAVMRGIQSMAERENP